MPELAELAQVPELLPELALELLPELLPELALELLPECPVLPQLRQSWMPCLQAMAQERLFRPYCFPNPHPRRDFQWPAQFCATMRLGFSCGPARPQ
jgi:hypothetical protein